MADVWDLAPVAGEQQDVWSLAPAVGGTAPSARRAQDLGDAIIAGLQSSATGLAIRGKLPDQMLGDDAPWYHRLAANASGIVADLPLSAVGAVAGGAAGSALPGPGTVIGAGAGAFAAPMALRDALVEAYSHNYAADWNGVWEIAKAAMKGGTKGAIIGGATAGAGGVAARAIGPAVVGGVGTTMTARGAIRTIEGAALGSELATLTATSAALDGRMPTWQDFMDNAVLLGGMKAAMHTAQAMRNIYADTGRTPEQIRADAERDPALKEALLKKPPLEIPESYRAQALEQRVQAAIDADAKTDMVRKVVSGERDWVPLGEPPINDPVKYEYITDRETARGVLRAVSQMYENEILAQTRGEVPNRQTAVEAMRAIDNGAIAERVIGEGASPSEVYARAHMLKGATNFAVTELRKLAAVPEAEHTPTMKLQALAAIERVAMLKAELEGAGAEVGRALQVFRAIKRDPGFLGEAETLVKLAERKGKLEDIARFVAGMKDPAQVAEFLKQYHQATTLEKVQEAWKAGILSGPQTHMANILGNLTKWFVEVPENVIAASLTALNKAAHGDPMTVAQWKARAFSSFYGIQHGAREAVFAAAEVWRGAGEHVEKGDVYRAAISGRKGEIIRTPFKALQVEDVLFRTVAERAKAYEMAVDRAVAEGLHPETQEARDRITLYTQRPEIGLTEKEANKVLADIQQAGAEAVFAQRLGPRMEIMQRAMQGSLLGFVIPFVRTPANLVSWAVQHVPGLNILSERWRNDFAAGGEARAKAVARVIVGTGLTITAYSLASSGVLTGGGLFDKEQGGTKRGAGWQPYSVKIGDKYYSYQRIEPVAKVLGLAADLVELSQATSDEQDKAKIAAMTVLMFGNATISTTYLSGVSNAIQALTDPERYGGNFLEQYATSLVPKAVGQTVTMADPYKREVDGVMEAIQSQLPFLREKLMPKRDVWGEPVRNDRYFDVLPVATSDASKDKVKNEAVRLQLAINDAPRFMMEKGPFNNKDKRVELTAEQRDIFRQVQGKHAMEILAPIVNAPDWEQIPDFAKAAIYKGVIEATRREASYKALPPDSAEREALRHKIIDRILRETQEAQSKGPEKK